MKNNKGFTLIELLAVILILGIIALIAIPTVNGVIKQSRQGATEQTGNQIVNSADSYYTMCDLNKGLDKNGNPCLNDLTTTNYSKEELSDVLGIKGAFPEIKDFIVFERNDDGTVSIVYRKDGLACSNIVNENGDIVFRNTGVINDKGIKCEEKVVSNSGNTLLKTDGSKHYLKKYLDYDVYWNLFQSAYQANRENPDYSSVFFDYKTYYDSVYEIKFVNHINIPDTVAVNDRWDVSEEQNESIMAWVEPYTEGSSWKTLYIGSTGKIYANPNSSLWLADFENAIRISLNNFYTDDVVDMTGLFAYDYSLATLDVSLLNTSNVENMKSMFESLETIEILDVSNFDTKKVVDMSSMFSDCFVRKIIGLEKFNTSNVTTMVDMFYYTPNLESLNLSNFNTSNVTNMAYMFYYCGAKSIELGDFDTSNVINMCAMFSYINTDLIDFSKIEMTSVKYMAGFLAGTHNSSGTFVFPNLDTSKVTDFSAMFANTKYEIIDITNLNTSSGVDFSNLFEGKIYAESSSVIRYDSVLKEIRGLDKLDTHSAENISRMFKGVYLIKNFDVTTFDVKNVKYMDAMFYGLKTSGTTVNTTGWNTEKLESVTHMFAGYWDPTYSVGDSNKVSKILGLENWNTNSLINAKGMFYRNYGISTVDLSGWNTARVENFTSMFQTCGVKKILVGSGWSTASVVEGAKMFSGAKSLVGGEGMTYDANKITYLYANTGPNGYLTLKN